MSETSESDCSNGTVLRKRAKKVIKHVSVSGSSKLNSTTIQKSNSESNPSINTNKIKTRKRKLKPKEISEELPEKRLIKLKKSKIIHYFIVDTKMPLKRLFCTVCEESIYSYRWSIITDHLNSKKHRESLNNIEDQLLTDAFMCTTNNNNSSDTGLPVLSVLPVNADNVNVDNTADETPAHLNCQFLSVNTNREDFSVQQTNSFIALDSQQMLYNLTFNGIIIYV